MRSILALCLLTIAMLAAPSQAQDSIFDTSLDSLFSNDQEFLPVDQAFQFDFNQQQDKLEVYFAIADGYYLYKGKLKFKAVDAEFTLPVLPRGEDHEDEYFGVQEVYYKQVKFTLPLSNVGPNGELTITYQGCADKGLCYPPTKQTVPLSGLVYAKGKSAENPTNSSANAILDAIGAAPVDVTKINGGTEPTNNGETISQQDELASMLAGNSLLFTLISFFGLGILLSFTPCVFPMYPILTGIIVGQGQHLTTRKAFTLSMAYVQGMAITYTALGIVVALAGAQFQAAFQHPAILIGLSILFVLLALSMFGVFNLALPTSWQNKLNNISRSQKGGSMISVLVMGAISGLVASPCTTAPLTGALIYIAQTGDVVIGASALYALSLGMGLPLLVLGSSGGKLLPKAGNWMTVIKNVFGFLLLAVPIFLLERFIAEMVSNLLWALLLLVTATYFYVVNNDNRKSPASIWYGLRALVIFVMLFFGANLAYNTLFTAGVAQQQTHKEFIHVASLEQLTVEVAKANSKGQSVMVDLYADWCIACKEFEKYTFPKPEVQQALHNTVLIQIDLTATGEPQNIDIMSNFDVFGLPSILFFDVNGNELSQQRVTGFMGAKEFANHINKIFN
ncbi:protein-disulfide reductase DsbD [Thalassotalea sp. ND16A]|uniref:protein-disulfide reductase DsbD n=1 Tax=Thalassotalea sp. ND16A TaxID=1535422 RepID=UPI00051A4948|nr:protein-disulfide reductase DsbD [Thalassotalea sp. ND16A]KGJ87848.1 Protein-disulfide reductase [Thalassotalea sp. ND16A]